MPAMEEISRLAARESKSVAESKTTTGSVSDVKKETKPSSLFIFSADNFIRKFACHLIEWPPFEWFILVAIFANCIVLTLEEHLPKNDKTPRSISLESTEIYFMIIFIFECVIKILAFGFVLHKNSYLRNVWNILDFIIIVCGVATMIPTGEGGQGYESNSRSDVNLEALRAVRVLRPLKLVSGFPSLQIVLKSILRAMPPLLHIAASVLFAIVIFAIIGLELFKGAFHAVCINEMNELLKKPTPCSTTSQNCPQNYTCLANRWEGPPNYLVGNFDNIFYAMLTVFQCITMEGWTTVMYYTTDAMNSRITCLYFIPMIILGSFFMLNLVLGVLSGEFAKEKERIENRLEFQKLLEMQLKKKAEGYFHWICKAEEVILSEDLTNEEERPTIIALRKKIATKKRKRTSQHKHTVEAKANVYTVMEMETNDTATVRMSRRGPLAKLRERIRRVVKSQFMYWLEITLAALNTICIASDHYGQPSWMEHFLFKAEMCFLVIFIFEMLIKMIGLGLRDYFRSSFNIFDCLVTTSCCLEVVWTLYHPNYSFGLSVLRALRLLRIFKVTKYWRYLKNIVLCLMYTIRSITSLLFLLFLLILTFALLGMQLFGGEFNFQPNNPKPFTHFDTFPIAFLTVFQILTGEDWSEIMYFAIQAKGGAIKGTAYSIFFIVLILVGSYTLLNVFLAIIVDNMAIVEALTDPIEPEKNTLEERQNDTHEDFVLLQLDPQNVEEGEEIAFAGQKTVIPFSSMFIFSPTNPIRILIHKIVCTIYFETAVMIFIVLSSISLAFENPVEEKASVNLILYYTDFIFTSVFIVELVLKVIDLGVILHPGSFLRDFWNIMDAVVVICALIGYTSVDSTGKAMKILRSIKSLRILRILRPLKTIKRISKLNAVFHCVVKSLKNNFNIIIVFVLFKFIFAVIAVQLFKGKFFYCSDGTKKFEQDCQGFFFVYETQNRAPKVEYRVWKKYPFNYDDTLSAMLTLFTVTTGEGWPGIRQLSMDTTEENKGPSPNIRMEVVIFYIAYFIVFPFLIVNVFVALMIITFQTQGTEELAREDLCKNRKLCIDFALNAKPHSMFKPENRETLQYRVWRTVSSTHFEHFMVFVILLNICMSMMDYYGSSQNYQEILKFGNYAFVGVFTIECILKLIAFGLKNYFENCWNAFDFIIVVGSIVDIIAGYYQFNIISLTFLRLFRAARIAKLRYTTRVLLWTSVQAFKELPYICLLIGMLLYIYAILGMQLLATARKSPICTVLTLTSLVLMHFTVLLVWLVSILLYNALFRCATGENWQDIMIACDINKSCDPLTGKVLEECGSRSSYIYFISFVSLSTFLMLNLFIAVIVDNFDYLTRDQSILGPHHLDEFVRAWAEYDPNACGKIHYKEMFKMLKGISPPVGFGSKCPDRLAYKRLIRMNMPCDEQQNVHFVTTLFALIREALYIKLKPIEEMDAADEELRLTLKKLWPMHAKKIDLAMPQNADLYCGKLTVGKIYSAQIIVETWRAKKNGKSPEFFETTQVQQPPLYSEDSEHAFGPSSSHVHVSHFDSLIDSDLTKKEAKGEGKAPSDPMRHS